MSEAETILIIDDHPVVLEGIALMLKEVRTSATLLIASNANEALKIVSDNNDIDWIFIDINLPDISGISLTKKLRAMNILSNIVLMSGEIEPSKVDANIELGKVYMTPQHANDLRYYRESLLLEKKHLDKKISSRQFQTLLMISKGFSNKEIAKQMNISENTVKSHVSALMTLFEADNRTHCVSEAQRLSIL